MEKKILTKIAFSLATEIHSKYPSKSDERPHVAFRLDSEYWVCAPMGNAGIYTRQGHYNAALDDPMRNIRLPDYREGKKHVISLVSLAVLKSTDFQDVQPVVNQQANRYLETYQKVIEYYLLGALSRNLNSVFNNVLDWELLLIKLHGEVEREKIFLIKEKAVERFMFLYREIEKIPEFEDALWKRKEFSRRTLQEFKQNNPSVENKN